MPEGKSRLSPRGWFVIYMIAIILFLLIIIYLAMGRPNHNHRKYAAEGAYDMHIVDGFTDDIHLSMYEINMNGLSNMTQITATTTSERQYRGFANDR